MKALDTIASSSDGYPFIVQRIASDAWNEAYKRNADSITITIDDYIKAAPIFTSKIYGSIVQPAIRSLSAVDIEFLTIMTKYDENVVPTSHIGHQLGKTKAYVGKYRQRLIKKHLIEKDSYGSVYCLLPFMMLYLENEEEARSLCCRMNTASMKESKSRELVKQALKANAS